MFSHIDVGIWASIISIVDDQGIVIQFPAWVTGFPVLHSIQISSVAHPAFTEWMLGALTWRWNDLSSPNA
jgi:hypothetical protein